MAAHGKTGDALVQYRDRKRNPRKVKVLDKMGKEVITVDYPGRYQKASYLKRAEKRKGRK